MPPPKLLKRARGDIKHDRANNRAILIVNESIPLPIKGVFQRALIENTPTVVYAHKMVVDENDEIKKWEIFADFSKADFEMLKIHNKNGEIIDIKSVAPQLNSSIFTYTNNLAGNLNINDDIFYKMKDNVFTHNHPRGSSFSRNDVFLAHEANVSGMEALANTKNFWNSIKSISENKNTILKELKKSKEKYKSYGMDNLFEITNYIEDFVKKSSYESKNPTVKFQLTPGKNGWNEKWKTYRPKADRMSAEIFHSFINLDIPDNAKILLMDHGMTKHAANKLDFNYSISTHTD